MSIALSHKKIVASTAAQWMAAANAKAADNQRRIDAQMEFSDMGLSYAAADLYIQIYHMAAELVEDGNNGMADFPALFKLDGTPVNAKLIQTRFNKTCWAVVGDDGRFTGEFLPFVGNLFDPAEYPSWAKGQKRTINNLAKKGYREGYVTRPAMIVIHAHGGCSWSPALEPDKFAEEDAAQAQAKAQA